jgi:hypothetical protein
VTEIGVPQAIEEPLNQPAEIAVEVDDQGEHRPNVQRHIERQPVDRVEPNPVPKQDEMRG